MFRVGDTAYFICSNRIIKSKITQIENVNKKWHWREPELIYDFENYRGIGKLWSSKENLLKDLEENMLDTTEGEN